MPNLELIRLEVIFMNDNVIIFGNGLNRLSKGALSWDDLLKNIASNVIPDVPNTLQYENLYLNNKLKKEENRTSLSEEDNEFAFKCKIRDELSGFKSNEVFKELASLNNVSYITPNYDSTLEKELVNQGFEFDDKKSDTTEKVYSVRRCHCFKKDGRETCVWPIHGEIRYPQTMMLGMDHYCGSIGKIDSYIKGRYDYEGKKIPSMIDKLNSTERKEEEAISWIDLLFTKNIHIIGFGMDFAELDIWWILNKRKRYIVEAKALVKNTIFFYDSEVNGSKADMLRALDVTVERVPCVNKHLEWNAYYLDIIDKIKSNF